MERLIQGKGYKLDKDYFQQDDVVALAEDLLGKVIFSNIDGHIVSAIISETEAYNGISDKASHAYGGKMTSRNRIMYGEGGLAYIYLCYGIHSLFNVVTNKENIPDAVLIRGVYPLEGIEIMEKRLVKQQPLKQMGNGPGKVSVVMGFHYSLSGISLLDDTIWIEDRGFAIPDDVKRRGPRIGVAYAGEDALLPYRFYVNDYEEINVKMKRF